MPYDSGAWDVVLAPRDAVPDAPACSPDSICWPARSSSLPRDRIAQNCTVRLAANSPSIRTSSDSAAWNGGAEGGQVLPCSATLHVLYDPRVIPHASCAQSCTASPTECRDYSAERCRGALERGGVPQRRRHPSSRNEPFVPLLTGVVEMRQPAPPCSKRPRSWGSRRSPPGRGGGARGRVRRRAPCLRNVTFARI